MRRRLATPGARALATLALPLGLALSAAAACGARSDMDPFASSGTGASTGVAVSTGVGASSSTATTGMTSSATESVASTVTVGSVVTSVTGSSSATGAGGTLDVASSSAAGGSCGIGYDETVTGKLVITADDQFALYAQGTFIEEPKANWKLTHSYEVPIFRHPSRRNVLAVRVTNLFKVDGRDRGLLLALSVFMPGSTVTQMLYSDGAFRAAEKVTLGWEKPDAPVSGWPLAIAQAPDGSTPWGKVLGDPAAKWIWSYDSNKPAVAKTEQELVYFRRDFYLGLDGTITDQPSACL